ncbi:MAG: hypothetical protein PF448_05875 [Bacteroidales bacterium]|nr:hypothetical protein [Bacteroidales bacterium]
MKKILIYILFYFTLINVFAQNLTYIGIEGGYKSDKYTTYDPAGHLKNNGTFGGNASFVVGQEILESVFIESGIIIHEYYESIGFKSQSSTNMSNALFSLQFPIRLKTSINLLNNKLLISPYTGLKYCHNLDYFESDVNSGDEGSLSSNFNGDYIGSGGGISSLFSEDKFEYITQENSNLRKNFILLETGITLEYQTKNRFIFGLSTTYNTGFSPIIYQEVIYSQNSGPDHPAYKISNGNYLNITFAIKAPISNLWQNKEAIKTKVKDNNQAIKKSNTPFYFGLEAGSAEYLFSSTGEYFTPFGKKWNNLSKNREFNGSLLFGYNITDYLTLETGINGKNLTNFYYYENDTSFIGIGFGSGGFEFISVPFRGMYRFKLLENKLEIKPYIGFSLLIPAKGSGKYDDNEHIDGTLAFDENNFPYHTDTVRITNAVAFYEKQLTVLANAGLRLEYAISPRISIMANGNFSLGFVDINRLAVKVEEAGNIHQGEILFDGTGYSLNAGLKYKFGKN